MNGRGQVQTFPNGGPDTINQGGVPGIHDQPNHYQGGYPSTSQHPQAGESAQYQYLSNEPPGGQGPSQHYSSVGSPDVQLTPYNNPQGGPPQRQGQLQQYSHGGLFQGQDSSWNYSPGIPQGQGQSQKYQDYGPTQAGPHHRFGLPLLYPHQGLGPLQPYPQAGPHQGQGPLQPYPQAGPHQGQGPAQPYPQVGPHQGKGPAQPYPQEGSHQGQGPAQPYPQVGPHQGQGPAQPYPQEGSHQGQCPAQPFPLGGSHQGQGPTQPYPQVGPHQGQSPAQPYPQVGPHQGKGPVQPYPQEGSHQGQGPAQPYPQEGPHQGQGPAQPYPQMGSHQGQGPQQPYPQFGPHQGQGPPQPYPPNGPPQGRGPSTNYYPKGGAFQEQGQAQPNQCTGQSPPTSMPSYGNDPVDKATNRSDSGETDMEVDEDLYGHGKEAKMKLPSPENQHGNGLTPTETPKDSKKYDPMTEHDKYYPDRFFVCGLSNKIREETLSDFVEVCSAYEVDKIEYSLDMSKAVVTLKLDKEQKLDTEDWSRIKSGIGKRLLEGSRIVFQRLPVSNKICVWHFHGDHPIPLQDYFEHPKSGNKANSAVDVKIQDKFSIVAFENFSVPDCVLSHKPHTLSGHTLVVTAFYDDLGPVKPAAPQTKEETFRFLSKGEGMLMSRLVDSLKVDYNLQEVITKGLEVKLKGDQSAVASAIDKLSSNLSEIKQRDVKCSTLKVEYLNSITGRKEMIAILDRKGILASWICHQASITIYALSVRDVSVTVSTIENDLKEEYLDVGRHFDALKDHLEHNFDKGKFLLCRKNNLWFLAHKEIFSDMKSEIDSFLMQKKPKETQHVSLSTEEYRVFQIVMPISMIRDDLERRYDVEIQDSGTGFSVYGHANNVKKACEDLKTKIRRDELCFDSKESERFQNIGNHGILLKHIEDKQKCVVKMGKKTVTVTGEDEDQGAGSKMESYGSKMESYGSKMESFGSKKRLYGSDKGSHGPDGYFYRKEKPDTGDNGWKQKKSRRADRKFVHNESTGETRLKITLVEGEIAKTDAEVGVNVVTKSFDMDFGGISKSFKKEGGHALEKECNSYKKKGFQINEGSFIRTSGGNLKCKHVFHCCIPLRSDPKCDEKYKELVKDMLKEAGRDLKCKSIALPALGTGVFHTFDASWVADTLYNSVTDFEKQELPNHLKEVKFVVYPMNKDVVKAFKDKDKKWKASQADKFGSSAKTHGSSVTFPKVSVIPGELATQETEVIVNTSNSALELSRGAVSKSILDKAGPSIQIECTKWRNSKGSVHPGHFAVTGAGNMKGTKKLYHCHLPHYNHDAIKLLKSMLMDILEIAEKYKTKDIAFPALGTGGLKYPPQEVAHTFFNVVHTFGLTHPDSTLKEIQLVVYAADKDVLQAFRHEEKLFLKKCLESASSTPAEPSPDYDDRENSFSTAEDYGPIKKFAVGPFTVTVKHGDISKEQNTCIVNPINSNMSLKTGSVSKALARVGGKEFEKKTGQADYILKDEHVAFVDLTKDTGVMHLDRQYLEKKPVDAIACCLKISKLHKFTSISFPILLTGDAAEKMAADLYSALLMLEPMASKTVQDVSVVIYDKSQADVFCRKFESLKGGPTKKSRVETQFVFQLYSDTYNRLQDGKSTLRDYAGDREITDFVNLPKNVTEKEISRFLRDHEVNVSHLSHRRLKVKGKPAEVLKALAVLKTLIAYKNDDEIDDHALFGDGKETQNMDYERESSMKHSLSSSTKTGYGGVGKPAFAGSLNKEKGYEDTTSEEFYWENGTKSSGSMDQEKKGYKYPSEVELENDSRFKTPTKGTEASAEASNSWSMSTEEDIPAAPYKMTWSFLDPDSEDLNEYGEDLSRQIEKAYRKGEMQFKLPPDEDGSEYIIDFKTMVEYPKTNPGDVVPVLRREEVKSSMPNLPSTWYAMDGQDQMITLKTSDGPFEKVKEHLENTRQGQPVFLVKIEKVQNKEVYGRYQWKKKTMKDTDGPMERLLWHPCVSTDSIVPINKHGMNLHFCQPTSEGPLGEGIEFFQNFTDIVQPTADKNQYAYLCNVLVGKYTKGQRGIRDPPSGESDESDFYHSVVDDVAKPSKYLIFSDTQVEPQYLVTYKLEKTGGNKN